MFRQSRTRRQNENRVIKRGGQKKKGITRVTNRVNIIENNLSRVCKQQDSLLPLLNMLEDETGIPRTEAALKNMQDKIKLVELRLQDNQSLLNNFDSSMEKLEQQEQNIKHLQYSNTNRQQRQTVENNQIPKQLENDVKQMGAELQNLEKQSKNFNYQIAQALKTNSTQAEQSIQEFKSKIVEQFHQAQSEAQQKLQQMQNVIQEEQSSNKKQSELGQKISQEDKEELLNQLREYVDQRISEVMDEMQEKHAKEIDFIFTHLGVLKCEHEQNKLQQRQAKLEPYLKDLPQDNEFYLNVKINNLEQALNLHNLDTFNKDNTERLLTEFLQAEEMCKSITQQTEEYNQMLQENPENVYLDENYQNYKEDFSSMDQQFLTLKIQMDGSKKMFINEMRTIQEKMENINNLKEEGVNLIEEYPELQPELEIAESFNEKIKLLMEEINISLESIIQKYDEIENTIAQNYDNAQELFNLEQQYLQEEDDEEEGDYDDE